MSFLFLQSSLFFLACTRAIPEELWEFAPIYGIMNNDDDNNSGEEDYIEELANENDLSSLVIPEEFFSLRRKNQDLRIFQNQDGIRIYVDGTLKSNSADDTFLLNFETAPKIEVEFLTYYTDTTITL